MSAVVIFMSFIGLLVGSLMACPYAVKKGLKPAKAVVMQICSFAILVVTAFAATAMISSAEGENATPAQEATTSVVAEQQGKSDKEWDGIAMALAIGLASIGSGMAVAAAAPAAIGAVSEDPKSFGKAIVFVGLAEGVAIFALLVVIFIKFL